MATNEKNVKSADKEKKMKTSEESAQEILDPINKSQKDFKDLNPDQRQAIIYDFNQKNKGIAEIIDDAEVDEEYINMCKKEFEEYQGSYLKLDYEICKKDKSVEYAEWLRDWNREHVFAPANYWIGVLKFEEVILEKIEELKKETSDFMVDYGALTYLYNLMMAPVCRGIEEAKWMANNQETYNNILNKLAEHVEMIDLIKKKIGLLQIRWSMACQGFKMNILAKSLDDFKEKSAVQSEPAPTTAEKMDEEEAKTKDADSKK